MTVHDVQAQETRRAVVEQYTRRVTLIFGVSGSVAGLVIGLLAHPATAWFATLEIGIPATLLGVLTGTLTGLIVTFSRRARV